MVPWNRLDRQLFGDVLATVEFAAARKGCTPERLWKELHKRFVNSDQYKAAPSDLVTAAVIELVRLTYRQWPLEKQLAASAVFKVSRLFAFRGEFPAAVHVQQ